MINFSLGHIVSHLLRILLYFSLHLVPSDKIISDALRDINKKLDELTRLVQAITQRLDTGDVDFT